MSRAREIRIAFDLSSMRELLMALRNVKSEQAQEIWKEAKKIQDKAQRLRDEERARFARNYDARVVAYAKYVRDEDKPPHRAHEPYPFRGAKMDEVEVQRAATLKAESGHFRRMTSITNGEFDRLAKLCEYARDMGLIKPGRDFERSASRQRLRDAWRDHGPGRERDR